MAACSLESGVKDVLQKLVTNIDELKNELRENLAFENQRFDEEEFWKHFVGSAELVSHEATKFCFVFNKPPAPSSEECQELASQVEGATRKLVYSYLGFPSSRGKTLRDELFKFVSLVLHSVYDLCIAIKSSSSNKLQSVGQVWSNCEAVEKLPKDNKEAVLAIFYSEESIVQDARNELKDAIENDTDEDDLDDIRHAFMQNGIRIPCPSQWTEFDRQILPPSLKMVEVYAACLKRVTKSISDNANNNEHSILELDEIVSIVKSSSSLVDDLVSSLYPPTNHSAILHHASLLKEKTLSLLSYLENSRFRAELDSLFVNLFRDALNSCWDQINERVLPQ